MDRWPDLVCLTRKQVSSELFTNPFHRRKRFGESANGKGHSVALPGCLLSKAREEIAHVIIEKGSRWNCRSGGVGGNAAADAGVARRAGQDAESSERVLRSDARAVAGVE